MTDFLARLQAMGYTPQGPATTGRRQYTQRVHVKALLYVIDVLQVKDDRGARAWAFYGVIVDPIYG